MARLNSAISNYQRRSFRQLTAAALSRPSCIQPFGTRLFIDAILGGFKPEPGFEAGVAVQKVLEAALKSHAERRWVDL
jgi:predicted dehydrogenase